MKTSAFGRSGCLTFLVSVLALILSPAGFARTLDLPPRSPEAPVGSAFRDEIATLPLVERENAIFSQVAQGNIPAFLRQLVAVSTQSVIDGQSRAATYWVTPDYLAIGSNEDYFLMPMTPLLAQRIADLLDCSLPTRKMVNEIWAAAPVKLAPSPIAPSAAMTTVPVFWDHNVTVRQQRAPTLSAHPLGTLIAGTKKDVIISGQIFTRPPPPRVCIYGWHQLNGTPIQPLSTLHENTYADYSHGIRLVSNHVTVDGVAFLLPDILAAPNLAALLSDEGTISPSRYPGVAGGPVILIEPRSRSVTPGHEVEFRVSAVGSGLTYQWRRDGGPLPGATGPTLRLAAVEANDAGLYQVVVSNASGVTTSRPVWLRVRTQVHPTLFASTALGPPGEEWIIRHGSSNNVPDYTVAWNFDYGEVSAVLHGVSRPIPASPSSADAETRGLRIAVNNNDTLAAIAGVNVYPAGQTFSGDFALRFDLWMNYPGGPGGAGSTGSTETAIFGLNHSGNWANWQATSASGPTDGIWFGVTGEGGSATDYRSFVGNPQGLQFELTGPASGLVETNHTAPFFQSLFPSSRFETPGAPGKNWVEVEIRQQNNVITWRLDDVVVAQRVNQSSFTEGKVMLGYMDTFPSIAHPAGDAFVIFANIRVEDLSAPPLLRPSVISPQDDHSIRAGDSLELVPEIAGSEPFRFQWHHNGMAIPGADGPSLRLQSVRASDEGQYFLQVTNEAGTARSAVFQVSIAPAPLLMLLPAFDPTRGRFSATVAGTGNNLLVIDSSSDLVAWTPLTIAEPTGPFSFWEDPAAGSEPKRFYRGRIAVSNLILSLAPFPHGAQALFLQPDGSGSTSVFLHPQGPHFTRISTSLPEGINADKALHIQWRFRVDANDPWLRLTTFNAPGQPNPTVRFDQAVRFKIHSNQPIRVALGLRETETTAAVGENGGVSGPIEWIGVSGENTSRPGGKLVPANTWTALTFLLPSEAVRGFTGNGSLESTTGRGVLEHIALTAAPTTEPMNVYLADFEWVSL